MQKDSDNALVCYRESDVVRNEVYTTSIETVCFSMEDFHDMKNGSYFPNKQLTHRIASAAGIEFLGAGTIKEVYGDLEIRNGIEVRPVVGYIAYRQGKKRRPDGTWQMSSPCNYEYNWIDRAEEAFLKDSEYDRPKYTFPNNPIKESIARKKYILDLKKKANRMASTGAALAVIRELIAIPTSWKKDDVMTGKIKVSQISESSAFQRAKAQSELYAIRSGASRADKVAELLGEDSFSQNFERSSRQTPDMDDNVDLSEEEPSESMEDVYLRNRELCSDRFKKWLDEEYMPSLNNDPNKFEKGLSAINYNNYGNGHE